MHTQGKWTILKARKYINVKGPKGEQMAQVPFYDDAKKIVHCVNNFDGMLEALNHFVKSFASGQREKCDVALEMAKKAIQQAEEPQ